MSLVQASQNDAFAHFMILSYPVYEFVGFLLFWFGAGWLSKTMLPADKNVNGPSVAEINDLATPIIPIVGLVFVVSALTTMAGLSVAYANNSDAFLEDRMAEALLKFVIGWALVLGGARIAALMKRVRTWPRPEDRAS